MEGDDLLTGFWFAMFLTQSMGFQTEPDVIYKHLRCLAQGKLTLTSPDDVLNESHASVRCPLVKHRDLASLVLRLLPNPG